MYAEQIWRELFRHVDLAESVSGVATLLSEELGVQAVVVLSLDLQHQVLRTLAEDRRAEPSAAARR